MDYGLLHHQRHFTFSTWLIFKTEVGVIDKAGMRAGQDGRSLYIVLLFVSCSITTLEGTGQGLQYCGWSNKKHPLRREWLS